MQRAFMRVTSASGDRVGFAAHRSPTTPRPGSMRASVTTSRSPSAGRRTTISTLPSSRGDPSTCGEPPLQLFDLHVGHAAAPSR